MTGNVYNNEKSDGEAPKRKRQRIRISATAVRAGGSETRGMEPVRSNEGENQSSRSDVFSAADILNIKILDKLLSYHEDDQSSYELCQKLFKETRGYSYLLNKKLGMNIKEFDSRNGSGALKKACQKMKRRVLDVILDDFKKNPTEEKRDVYNKILQPYDRKIEKIPEVKTDNNVQLVVRGAFEGEFTMPNLLSTNNGEGYSREYVKFADPHNQALTDVIGSGKLPADYDWSKNPAVQAMSLSQNMSQLIPDLQQAVKHQRIPQEVVENLTISDVGHILYKEKNNGKTPSELQKVSFKSLNNKCDEGARIKFWREFGKDKKKMDSLKSLLETRGVSSEYIKDLLTQIKTKGTVTLDVNKYDGVIPKLSVHHKVYVQDAAALGKNAIKIDDPENFTAVVDFPDEKNHKEFEHAADTHDTKGNVYRLTNLKDTKDKTVYLQAGTVSFTAQRREDYSNRLTYTDIARGGYQ